MFYTGIVIISTIALLTMYILVRENARFDKKTKKRFYLTYIIIGTAMVCEYLGVILNNTPSWTVPFHLLVKFIDYSLSPLTALVFVYQISGKGKIEKSIVYLTYVNVVFQFISIFTGLTFYVDKENVYHHGNYHFLYVLIYIAAFIFAVISYWKYGKAFERGNRGSLVGIGVMIAIAIILQELLPFDIRACGPALVFACILQFVHFSEFTQQKIDDDIEMKNMLLETDPLTQMLSRYAYNESLKDYERDAVSDDKLVVFSIDINGLKAVNDTCGHLAGDELIQGAASCISKVFSSYGKCFRTGGDEFIVIIDADRQTLTKLISKLDNEVEHWSGKLTHNASLAYGYASKYEFPFYSIYDLLITADERMYANKEKYYNKMGIIRTHLAPLGNVKAD